MGPAARYQNVTMIRFGSRWARCRPRSLCARWLKGPVLESGLPDQPSYPAIVAAAFAGTLESAPWFYTVVFAVLDGQADGPTRAALRTCTARKQGLGG